MLTMCTSCYQVHPGASCPHCTSGPSRVGRNARVALGAALLGLTLVGCEDPLAGEVVALYGAAVEDQDGDGYALPEDCDDSDAEVHPDAEEVVGDGVDSNCNDDDDT